MIDEKLLTSQERVRIQREAKPGGHGMQELAHFGTYIQQYELTLRAVEAERDYWNNERDEYANEIVALRGELKDVEEERDAALAQVKELQKKLAKTQWRMAP